MTQQANQPQDLERTDGHEEEPLQEVSMKQAVDHAKRENPQVAYY